MTFLLAATVTGMALWFMAAATLPDMAREAGVDEAALARLSSAVPAGFGAGALLFAVLGIPDRFDPRAVFALSTLAAAAANLALLAVPIGGPEATGLRFLTGALMAGTWPVSMKIAVGWTRARRGLLMGALVAALVAGKGVPYLLAWLGGADWRLATILGSAVAGSGAGMILLAGLGPHHVRAPRFRPGAVALAWRNPAIRQPILGYLGHMWEFIAFWSWVGTMAALSYAHAMPEADAIALGKLTAFLSVLAAAPACLAGGFLADRIGKARIAGAALAVSGSAAVASALAFGGPVWLSFALFLVWGAAVVPDSPQFSALVADAAPPEFAGSLLTFQAALGFTMTAFTVEIAPVVAEAAGWPAVMLGLALGPLFGLRALARRPGAA